MRVTRYAEVAYPGPGFDVAILNVPWQLASAWASASAAGCALVQFASAWWLVVIADDHGSAMLQSGSKLLSGFVRRTGFCSSVRRAKVNRKEVVSIMVVTISS